MEVNIRVLNSGYFVTVKEGDEIIAEEACSHGKWNLGAVLNKYLYEANGYSSKTTTKASKKKSTKKSSKKVNKRKL